MCQASPWEPTFLNLLSNQQGWGQAHPEPAADTGSGEGSPAPAGGAATQPQLEGDQPHTHLIHFNEGKRQLLHLGRDSCLERDSSDRHGVCLEVH